MFSARCLLGILFAFIAYPAYGDLIRVYLLAGQSNADGRALSTLLPASLQQPQTDVDFFFHVEGSHPLENQLIDLQPGSPEFNQPNYFGPEITFGRAMADYFASDPNTSIAVIKYANGGTNLHTQWKAGGSGSDEGDGSEYVAFQETVYAGLASIQTANPEDTVVVSGMIWHQGESDSLNVSSASSYEENLSDFIADIRGTYAANLPFIIGEIANNGTNYQIVQDAQKAVSSADPLTKFVSSDELELKADNIHFNANGQQTLGWNFATQMQIQSIPESSSFVLVGLFSLLLFPQSIARRKRERRASRRCLANPSACRG